MNSVIPPSTRLLSTQQRWISKKSSVHKKMFLKIRPIHSFGDINNFSNPVTLGPIYIINKILIILILFQFSFLFSLFNFFYLSRLPSLLIFSKPLEIFWNMRLPHILSTTSLAIHQKSSPKKQSKKETDSSIMGRHHSTQNSAMEVKTVSSTCNFRTRREAIRHYATRSAEPRAGPCTS